MTTSRTLLFDCPACHEELAQVEEPDRDLHTGETYRCASCGGAVVFLALTVEEYADPARLRMDCYFCRPGPCRLGPSTDTDNREKGETT